MARGRKAAVVEAGPVEGPWDLPEAWRWMAAGDALPLSYGKALSAKIRSASGTVPVFGSSGAVGVHDQALIDGPSIIVGRKGSAGAVHYSSGPSWPIDTVYFARGTDLVDVRYGFHLLRWLRLDRLDQSTAIPSLSRDNYDPIPIPVPPLDTQRRVVARIDELFSELDDGEAALARARADLETYRKSLLKAAVTGELTADWRAANPPTETGEQLLQRILADRKARWEADSKNKGKRYKEAIEPTGKLPELPSGWAWCSVDQLIMGLRNGVSDKPNNQPPGTPIFKISAVRELEVRTSEIRWLPEHVAVTEATVAPGDLLFTRYNGSPDLVGVCGRYRGEIPVAYPDKLMRAQPVSQDDGLADFLELAANSGATRAYIQSYTKTSAGQHGVSGETVKSAPIPLPPLAEAVEIARCFRESLVARAAASMSLDHLATGSNDLRQSILAAAFRGKLVQ